MVRIPNERARMLQLAQERPSRTGVSRGAITAGDGWIIIDDQPMNRAISAGEAANAVAGRSRSPLPLRISTGTESCHVETSRFAQLMWFVLAVAEGEPHAEA